MNDDRRNDRRAFRERADMGNVFTGQSRRIRRQQFVYRHLDSRTERIGAGYRIVRRIRRIAFPGSHIVDHRAPAAPEPLRSLDLGSCRSRSPDPTVSPSLVRPTRPSPPVPTRPPPLRSTTISKLNSDLTRRRGMRLHRNRNTSERGCLSNTIRACRASLRTSARSDSENRTLRPRRATWSKSIFEGSVYPVKRSIGGTAARAARTPLPIKGTPQLKRHSSHRTQSRIVSTRPVPHALFLHICTDRVINMPESARPTDSRTSTARPRQASGGFEAACGVPPSAVNTLIIPFGSR